MTTSLHVAATPAWVDRHRGTLAAFASAPGVHPSGDALARALDADFNLDALVVIDLALASPALVSRLGPYGPRVLAFGDPTNAGLALAANLADFISDDLTSLELTAAIETALTDRPPAGVGDLSDRAVARLGALGAEATRIADALARLEAAATDRSLPPLDAGRIRAMIEGRRARERFFPGAILGEPAWDMLLDLTAAAAERCEVGVTSLCIAAAVPTTTALRWIRTMIDLRLFERRDDPRDARRAFISLSEPALAAMARYLAQAT